MASYQQLQDDVQAWLNRRDIASLIPGWVSMVETEIAETVRSRVQVAYGEQPIDNAYITLPPGFAAMESIRDAQTGELLRLKDQWSGAWQEAYMPSPWSVYGQLRNNAPSTGYRLLADCIEFLPHPLIPDPPDPDWKPQIVLMGWYQRPLAGSATFPALVLPADTNPILETFYGIYLFGVCKYGALYELDDDRAQQVDAQWQQVVTRANLWKQQSDYSGAPYVEEMAVRF